MTFAASTLFMRVCGLLGRVRRLCDTGVGSTMRDESCGLVLNRLYEPCHLPALHEGFHESLSPDNSSIVVEWWTPNAPSRERRYSIRSPKADLASGQEAPH